MQPNGLFFSILKASAFTAAIALGVDSTAAQTSANTEKLATPVGLTVASGTTVTTAGIGLENASPIGSGTLKITVPAGTIKQVLAYWEGYTRKEVDHGNTDALVLGGKPVKGLRIGGATEAWSTVWTATYRADITTLGLISNGANSLTISGMDFAHLNHGLGLIVITDDGSGATSIDLRDGNDFAFVGFSAPLNTTVPQNFTFGASTQPRIAKISVMVASVATNRPSVISYAIDGGTAVRLLDKLGNSDGPEWDTFDFDVTIPAGATSLRLQLHSEDGNSPSTGLLPASMIWLASTMNLRQPVAQGGEGCTPGFWKSKTWSKIWDGLGTDDVTSTIKTTSGFNATMGVTASQSGLADTVTLLDAVRLGGGHLKALTRHAAAALANADASTIDYPMSLAQIIALYRSVVVTHTTNWEVAKDKLAAANELGCDPK